MHYPIDRVVRASPSTQACLGTAYSRARGGWEGVHLRGSTTGTAASFPGSNDDARTIRINSAP